MKHLKTTYPVSESMIRLILSLVIVVVISGTADAVQSASAVIYNADTEWTIKVDQEQQGSARNMADSDDKEQSFRSNTHRALSSPDVGHSGQRFRTVLALVCIPEPPPPRVP